MLAAVSERSRRAGSDLNVGGRLPRPIAESGCRLLDLVPLMPFIRPDGAFWDWPTQSFFSHVARLVEAGLLTESDRRELEAEWRTLEQDQGGFLSAPPVIGIIACQRSFIIPPPAVIDNIPTPG